MFINGVKVTITICLTIIVSSVLFISYSEYIHRYTIVSSPDNSVYIFDKKSTTLNKCDEKGCKFLETKLPINAGNDIANRIMEAPSKIFGEDKPMTEEIAKVEASPKIEQNPKQDREEAPQQAPQEKREENNTEKKQNKEKQPNTNKPITIKK